VEERKSVSWGRETKVQPCFLGRDEISLDSKLTFADREPASLESLELARNGVDEKELDETVNVF